MHERDCRAQGPFKDIDNAIRTQFSHFLVPLPGHSLLSYTYNYPTDSNEGDEGLSFANLSNVVKFNVQVGRIQADTPVPLTTIKVVVGGIGEEGMTREES